jgi:hypothetical protein
MNGTTMGSGVVETRCNFKIGIAEPLILYREAFILMAFVGHRMKVIDDPFNRSIVALLVCR